MFDIIRKTSNKPMRMMLALALLAGAWLATTAAHPQDITLDVTVTDCVTKQPISQASVKVLTAATNRSSQSLGTTDANGKVSLFPVRVGDRMHTVEISAPGYTSRMVVRWMNAWTTQTINICLEPGGAPVTPISNPTVIPTLDSGAPERCSGVILRNIKGLGRVEEANALAAELAGYSSCLVDCSRAFKSDAGSRECVQTCPQVAQEKKNEALAKLLSAGINSKSIALGCLNSSLWNLLEDPVAQTECGSSGPFTWLLIRDLARNGVRISALGIHSAAVAMITDKEGRRTGFLKDGKILEEIPDSKAAISRESKYILYPADLEVKVKFEATGEGTLTLEMIHTKGVLVQDMSYKDLVLTQKTVGEMDFSNQRPVLKVDGDGSGNFSTRSADRFEEFQAIRPATSTPPVILSFTPSPLTPAPPTATPPPAPGGLAGLEWMDVGSYLVCGTSGLLVGIGVALIGFWFAQRSKKP